MSKDSGVSMILASGRLVNDNVYELTVSGLPDREAAKELAAKMAGYVAQALTEIVGAPPTGAIVRGPGATPEVAKEIAEKAGVDVNSTEGLAKAISDAFDKIVEEIGGNPDDCECPNCVARRALEEKRAANGPNPSTKH